MDLSGEDKHVSISNSCSVLSKNLIILYITKVFFKLLSYRWDLLPLLVWMVDLVCSVLWH